MLQQLIITVLNYLNASGYYKSAGEIQSAINNFSFAYYLRVRGNLAQYRPGQPAAAINPGQTIVSSDAIAELYRVYTIAGPGPLTIVANDGRTPDLVQSIELQYENNGPYYQMGILPDSQFLLVKDNPVIGAEDAHPKGRMNGVLTYEVAPADYLFAKCRVLTQPTNCAFTFADSGGPIPTINITTQLDWTLEKLPNFVYGTVAELGFNIQNGVLVQAGNAMNEKQM